MTNGQNMRFIVLPQALKIILPAMANEFVTLIKETSILSYVGIVEITRSGVLWASREFQTFPAYIGVAIIYLCMTIPLSRLVAYLEKRMGTSAPRRRERQVCSRDKSKKSYKIFRRECRASGYLRGDQAE